MEECTSEIVLATGQYNLTCPVTPNIDIPQEEIDFSNEMMEEDIPEITPLTPCTSGDQDCLLQNIITNQTNLNQEIIYNQQQIHNNQVLIHERAAIQNHQDLVRIQNSIVNNTNITQSSNEEVVRAVEKLTDEISNGSSATGPSDLDVSGFDGIDEGEASAAVGGLDDKLTEQVVNVENYTAQYSDWAVGGTACPDEKSFSFDVAGNSFSIDMPWKPVCDIFSLIGQLILVSAWIAVAFMIHRSL